MIDGLHIRNSDREIIGYLDGFTSVIWHAVYYGVGDFEIYTRLTPEILDILQIGNYVTRETRDDVGIIEAINISYDASDGYMITATGRFAKSLLDRRLIYSLSGYTITPVTSYGNVEAAARALVKSSIISATDTARNVSFIELGDLAGLSATIIDDDGDAAYKQTSYGNLLDYTDNLLKEYGYSAKIVLNLETLNLQYVVFEGTDRTIGTAEPLIFSQEFDNLLSSDYTDDVTNLKNTAFCGGEGEGTDRKFVLVTSGDTGLNRREIFVDGSSQSQTYTDESGEQQSYTDAEYLGMLKTAASAGLTEYVETISLDGDVDLTTGTLIFGVDYDVGDVVTVEECNLGVYINTRITEITEVQDESGYSVKVSFEND